MVNGRNHYPLCFGHPNARGRTLIGAQRLTISLTTYNIRIGIVGKTLVGISHNSPSKIPRRDPLSVTSHLRYPEGPKGHSLFWTSAVQFSYWGECII